MCILYASVIYELVESGLGSMPSDASNDEGAIEKPYGFEASSWSRPGITDGASEKYGSLQSEYEVGVGGSVACAYEYYLFTF